MISEIKSADRRCRGAGVGCLIAMAATTSRQKPAFSSALKTTGALSVKCSMARRAPAPLKWVHAELKCCESAFATPHHVLYQEK